MNPMIRAAVLASAAEARGEWDRLDPIGRAALRIAATKHGSRAEKKLWNAAEDLGLVRDIRGALCDLKGDGLVDDDWNLTAVGKALALAGESNGDRR